MLGIKVNWKAVKNTPMATMLMAMQAEQEAGTATYTRMAGHSRSGPCAICAQYFGMEHDKSGRIVPLIKLHRDCVCRDVLTKLARDLGKVPLVPMKRFQFIESVPVGVQRAMLGKAKSALLTQAQDKLGTLKQMVGRTKVKRIDSLTAILKGNTVEELQVMGLRQGMKASELAGLSKEQLSKNVLSKMRGRVVAKPEPFLPAKAPGVIKKPLTATTPAKAEEWARQNLVAPSAGVAPRVNYKGFSAKTANMVNTRLASYTNKGLPKLRNIEALGAESVGSQEFVAQIMPAFGDLQFNAALINSPAKYKKLYQVAEKDFVKRGQKELVRYKKYARKTGSVEQARYGTIKESLKYKRQITGPNIDSVIDHEMGHYVHTWGGAISKAPAEWGKVTQDAIAEAMQAQYKYKISAYAATSEREMFAECFSLYKQGIFKDVPPKMLKLFQGLNI